MKYERTASAKADWERLSVAERRLFMDAVREMNETAGPHPRRTPHFPARLRVDQLEGSSFSGIYEMTWSFSGPDGRATFEFFREDGEIGIRWRRIGDHRIFKNP